MKRMVAFSFLFISLCTLAFAAELDQAIDEQALLNYFNQAYASAEQTRADLDKADYESCIDNGQLALNAFSVGKQLAQKGGVKIINAPSYKAQTTQGFQVLRGNEGQAPVVLNPFVTFPDLAENILFAKVMAKKYSLVQTLQQANASPDGLVAYLQGKTSHMASAFQSVGEAFASWKGCAAALKEAYEQGQVQITAEDFCRG